MSENARSLDPKAFEDVVREGVPALDLRPLALFARGHVQGAASVPYGRAGFPDQVLDMMSPGRVLLVDDIPAVTKMARADLEEAGFKVVGVLSGGSRAWEASGRTLEVLDQVTADELWDLVKDVKVIDVREPYELAQGVIPGAIRIPLNMLPEAVHDLDPAETHVLVCATGFRSLVAQAYLHRRGLRKVRNLVGGMALWEGCGYPVER